MNPWSACSTILKSTLENYQQGRELLNWIEKDVRGLTPAVAAVIRAPLCNAWRKALERCWVSRLWRGAQATAARETAVASLSFGKYCQLATQPCAAVFGPFKDRLLLGTQWSESESNRNSWAFWILHCASPTMPQYSKTTSSSSTMSSFMCCTSDRSSKTFAYKESQSRFLWLDPTRWVEKRSKKEVGNSSSVTSSADIPLVFWSLPPFLDQFHGFISSVVNTFQGELCTKNGLCQCCNSTRFSGLLALINCCFFGRKWAHMCQVFVRFLFIMGNFCWIVRPCTSFVYNQRCTLGAIAAVLCPRKEWFCTLSPLPLSIGRWSQYLPVMPSPCWTQKWQI